MASQKHVNEKARLGRPVNSQFVHNISRFSYPILVSLNLYKTNYFNEEFITTCCISPGA
jgi:hypothetical protein